MIPDRQLEQLYPLLDKAERLASQFEGGYSDHFFSAQEFHEALAESIAKLKSGDTDQLITLWLWFTPTYDWDDFVRGDGQHLANEIFPLLTDLKQQLNVHTIIDLIIDYQDTVGKVMKAFQKEFNRADLLTAYRSDKLYPPIGSLQKHHIKHYSFHGIGLAVDFDDDTSVDFDFAFLPDQRHDGFDLWRLWLFASSRPVKYRRFVDRKMLEDDFQKLIDHETIVKPVVTPATELYFFASALKKPEAQILQTTKAWWKFW